MSLAQIERAVVLAGIAVLGIALLLCAYRIIRGPSAFDRALAFDAAVLQVLGIVLLFAMRTNDVVFLDVVLVVALLGFLGTVSLASYLEGRLVD
jgi:multisubunit Na+/H+ antiporter MnhF subunit